MLPDDTHNPWPAAFSARMEEQLGNEWPAFVAAHERPSPVSIRLNPAKGWSASDKTAVPWALDGRYLESRPSFNLEPAFHAGAYYVQEASSMFLEQAFLQIGGNKPGLHVLDLCAAPGGKSTHLLSMMSADSLLVSNEVIKARAAVLSVNVQKWGHNNVIVTSSDPQAFASIESFFDIAVVDAPCSGEGMFRKEASAIENWSTENIEHCARRQQRIIEEVWPSIRPGGYLIYSTCTYNERENEECLQALLNRDDAAAVTLNINPSWRIAEGTANAVTYRLYPHRVDGEGLCMAVVQKTSGNPVGRSKKNADTLDKVAAKPAAEIRQWLTRDCALFAFNDDIRALQPNHDQLLAFLTRRLYIVNAGTCLGSVKHHKIVPAHAAALSVYLNHERFNVLDVDRETALRFLRKESIDAASSPRGFTLVRFEGLGLGWINVIDKRTNNLYPWRVVVSP